MYHIVCVINVVVVVVTVRYCGSTAPAVITSASNRLRVVFTTDASDTRQGFVATYVSIDLGESKMTLVVFLSEGLGWWEEV